MFLSELLSFGDFSCTDVCFRFNKMDLDGTEAQSTKKIHSKNATAKSLSKDSTTNLIDPERKRGSTDGREACDRDVQLSWRPPLMSGHVSLHS